MRAANGSWWICPPTGGASRIDGNRILVFGFIRSPAPAAFVEFAPCRCGGDPELTVVHPALLDHDWRALDKRSAHAGSVISRLVLEHSPVVFGCRYTPEDMVVLDLIGRYRFPVKVILWDVCLPAAEAKSLREFVAKRYVFSSPVLHIRDERFGASTLAPRAAEAYDGLAVAFTGCRAWLSGARRENSPDVIELMRDPSSAVTRCNPLADWREDEVRFYLERWELAFAAASAA
jgi:3'-phosphoadenosine 5'-phosphosulfate sulfotransferase (PAPS reductase)/FAD synthetase